LVNGAEDFRFVADETVGEKTNKTQPAGIVWKIERGLDAFDHHRAAADAHRLEIVEAAPDILRRGRERSVAEAPGALREADDLKGIAGLKEAQAAPDGGLG